MSKYLVLYRHGMAEDKEEAPSDDLRSLSPRGKHLLKKSVSGFKTMIEDYDKIKIYSSPKSRSEETAIMLAEELNLEKPTYLEFLGTGGSVALLRELIDNIESNTLAIIVGQQPFLSLWSQEISGSFLRFKKGSAACFKVPEGPGETKAELRWYLQTRDFVKIEDK